MRYNSIRRLFIASNIFLLFTLQALASAQESIGQSPLSNTSLSSPYPNAQAKIIGGTQAGPNDYPWMAAIIWADTPAVSGAQFCGGSLVESNLVVTAAHCVDNLIASQIEVVVGVSDLSIATLADRVSVANITIHPSYDGNLRNGNDIAIVKLNVDLAQTPIAWADREVFSQLKPQTLLRVAGWGSTSQSILNYVNELSVVDLFYVNQDVCKQTLAVTDSFFCAGYYEGGRDSCYGDSGGPLMYFDNVQWWLVGQVSWGKGCALPDAYSANTNVSEFLNWYKQVANSVAVSTTRHLYAGVGESVKFKIRLDNNSVDEESIQSVTNDNLGLFNVAFHQCQTIAPLEQCTIEMLFEPVIAGTSAATILINTPGFTVSEVQKATGLEVFESEVFGSEDLDWYSGGDVVWNESGTGDALNSGPLLNGQSSVLKTYIVGPGKISFDWSTDTEKAHDALKLVVEGITIAEISGKNAWQSNSLIIPAGNFHVAWVYGKDQSLSHGEDTVWLKNISFTEGVFIAGSEPTNPLGIGFDVVSSTTVDTSNNYQSLLALPVGFGWYYNHYLPPDYIGEAEEINGKTVTPIVSSNGDREYFILNENGISLAGSFSGELQSIFEEPMPILANENIEGSINNFNSVVTVKTVNNKCMRSNADITGYSTFLGYEQIETPIKTVTAAHIYFEYQSSVMQLQFGSYAIGKFKHIWLSDDLGIVQFRNDTTPPWEYGTTNTQTGFFKYDVEGSKTPECNPSDSAIGSTSQSNGGAFSIMGVIFLLVSVVVVRNGRNLLSALTSLDTQGRFACHPSSQY